MREIAKSRRVIAPDLPGTGDSAPLTQASPVMQDYADALRGAKIGQTVSIVVARDGDRIKLTITPTSRSE